MRLCFFFFCKHLLLDGVVILAFFATPVNWVELEESESATLAGGGAHAGASSGLEGHWLNRDEVNGWAEFWRSGDGFFIALGAKRDGWSSLLWSSWVGLRSHWSQNKKVGWSALSETVWSGGWFFSESEEGGVSSRHGCVVRKSRVRSVNWGGLSWDESLELHFERYYLFVICVISNKIM